MAGGANEVDAAVDTGVLNVTVAHSGELFAEVRAVLVLDVFDDRVPAEEERKTSGTCLTIEYNNLPVLVVDLVPVSRRIDDVQPQLDTIFNNDYTTRNDLSLVHSQGKSSITHHETPSQSL